MYCQECRTAVSLTCFTEWHNTHRCLDAKKVRYVFTDTEKIDEQLAKTNDALSHLEEAACSGGRRELGKQLEDDINITADKFIAVVQRYREKLLSEAGSIIQTQVRQEETVKRELKEHKTALENFKRDREALLNSETAGGDVVEGLHQRAEKLIKLDVIGHMDNSLPYLKPTFIPSTLLEQLSREDRNIVGTVSLEGQLEQAKM